MAILLNNTGDDNAPWRQVLSQELPHLAIFEPARITDPQAIHYAVIWEHPHDDLHRYPNLKAILNLGAGTDHLDLDPALDKMKGVPIVRLIDPDVGIDMAHYTLYWTMHFQRDYEQYRRHQTERTWGKIKRPRIQDWRVAVLGMGRIGEFVAQQLLVMGYSVNVWNRSDKSLNGAQSFFGQAQLHAALSNVNVVVNCLPLTAETTGLIEESCFAAMPSDSYLINISRGAVVDQSALVAALETQQIAGAALDCFEVEPLPQDSALWAMPNVHITPHMSGATYARSAALAVVDNIKKMERGEQPSPIVRTT